MDTKLLIKIVFLALTVGLNFLRLMPKNRLTKKISMLGNLIYGLVILKMADMAFHTSFWLGYIVAGFGVCMLLAAFKDFLDLLPNGRYGKRNDS